MKKVALLTILLVVAASAAITFPNGAPSKVGVEVDVSIPGTGTANLYVISGGNQYWVYPYQNVSLPYNGKIEITHPGSGLKLLARGITDDSSAAFDVVIGDPYRWQLIASGETAVAGDARSTTGKSGNASVTAGDTADYNVNICDKWWNLTTGSYTPSLATSDPFGHLPANPVVGTNSIELRRAGAQTVTVSDGGLTDDSSNVNVAVNTPAYLLMICGNNETRVAGDDSTDTYLPGKEGVIDPASLGTDYDVTIYAVDKCWNRVSNYQADDVTILDEDNVELNNPPETAFPIVGGTVEVPIDFKGVNTIGEYISARDAKGLQSKYPTPVVVNPGIDSLYTYLDKPIVPVGVHSTLHVEAFTAGQPVGAGSKIAVDLTSGPEESFHISVSGGSPWIIETNSSGVAECEVWADAETTYILQITAGSQTNDETLTVQELDELLIRPNPYVYERHSALPISFDYKVEQVGTGGASEVKLLVADPYGNLVYTATYDIDETQTNPGQQTVTWDGFNSKGVRVASGMYQAVLKITLINGSTSVLKKNFMVIW